VQTKKKSANCNNKYCERLKPYSAGLPTAYNTSKLPVATFCAYGCYCTSKNMQESWLREEKKGLQ